MTEKTNEEQLKADILSAISDFIYKEYHVEAEKGTEEEQEKIIERILNKERKERQRIREVILRILLEIYKSFDRIN